MTALHLESGANPIFSLLRKSTPSLHEVFAEANTIMAAFGALMERDKGGSIKDASKLPYPKKRIVAAAHIIWKYDTRSESRELLRGCIFCLAEYQDGVGKYDLFPGGIDMSQFDIGEFSSKNLTALMSANPSGAFYFDRFNALVEADRARLLAAIESIV